MVYKLSCGWMEGLTHNFFHPIICEWDVIDGHYVIYKALNTPFIKKGELRNVNNYEVVYELRIEGHLFDFRELSEVLNKCLFKDHKFEVTFETHDPDEGNDIKKGRSEVQW